MGYHALLSPHLHGSQMYSSVLTQHSKTLDVRKKTWHKCAPFQSKSPDFWSFAYHSASSLWRWFCSYWLIVGHLPLIYQWKELPFWVDPPRFGRGGHWWIWWIKCGSRKKSKQHQTPTNLFGLGFCGNGSENISFLLVSSSGCKLRKAVDKGYFLTSCVDCSLFFINACRKLRNMWAACSDFRVHIFWGIWAVFIRIFSDLMYKFTF